MVLILAAVLIFLDTVFTDTAAVNVTRVMLALPPEPLFIPVICSDCLLAPNVTEIVGDCLVDSFSISMLSPGLQPYPVLELEPVTIVKL